MSMDHMEHLEDDYPGDAWSELVSVYESHYLDDGARQLARIMNGHQDMAVIIRGKRGLEEGLWWIEQEVPSLDNLRPLDCLTDPRLILRLRTGLMRMP